MTIAEHWASLPELRWLYEVSNLGNIRRIANNRMLHPFVKKNKGNGYSYIKVFGKNLRVHILVAKAFVCNPFGKREVHHIDHNKQNNAASNLAWVNRCENIFEEIKAGRLRARMKYDPHSLYIPFDFEDAYPPYPRSTPTPP